MIDRKRTLAKPVAPGRAVLVAALLFCSGFSALVFQTAWLRELRLVFGGSTSASAAVLAIFMGGLGVGNAVLGKRADRHGDPLRLYAGLMLLIGISGAASPLLSDFVRQVYIALGGQSALGIVGATAARLLCSMLVLGLPTFLMGGTLSAAACVVTPPTDRNRRSVGLLFGMNELGAVAGAAGSTFFLLEHLGTRRTLWLACGVYLAASLIGYAAARLLGRPVAEAGSTNFRSLPEPPDAEPQAWPPLLYSVAGVAGFAFFLMELVWYRMLAPILGGTTFAFGLILTVVLAGIGLGGAAYALLFAKVRPSLGLLSLLAALEAAAVAYPFAWGDGLAMQALLFRSQGVCGVNSLVFGWTVITALVVLPTALVAGFQFPLLIALLGRGSRDVGKQVGRAFAWNTVGAILGSLAGGFGLLPLLSAPGAWRAVVLLLAGQTALVALASLRRERRPAVVAGSTAVLAAALTLLCATGPTAVWRHSGIGAGRATLTAWTPNAIRDWRQAIVRCICWQADGVEASIAISDGFSFSFYVNGKIDGNAIADADTQIMSGLLEGILHGRPQTGLVVGLGTGETAGWMAEIPSMRHVDVVEIEPRVLEMARRCADVNHQVLEHPKVGIAVADAREFLLTSTARYDLIFSEPSNPYRAGIASLFTREFYRAVRQRLQPGGIFGQWLQAYEVDQQTVRTALATLRNVFGHVEIWQTGPNDMLMICTEQPLAYDAALLRRQIGDAPYRSALAVAWQTRDLEGFLAHYVAGQEAVEKFSLQDAERTNSDDCNYIEYGFARTVGQRGGGFSIGKLRNLAVACGAQRPAVSGKVQWERVEDERQVLYGVGHGDVLIPPSPTPAQRTRAAIFDCFWKEDYAGVVALWQARDYAAVSPAESAYLCLALALQGRTEAVPLLAELRGAMPAEADAIRAALLLQKGDTPRAADLLVEVFTRLHDDPWILSVVGQIALKAAATVADRDPRQAARLYAAVRTPFAAEQFEDQRRRTAFTLAREPAQTMESLAALEPYPPWEEPLLQRRLGIYRAADDPRASAAAADLREYHRNAAVEMKTSASR
ncbi:MAG: fused MFS/spermidine synthase [Thermoguttaceae bacterium]|jgi:hypothetical protein